MTFTRQQCALAALFAAVALVACAAPVKEKTIEILVTNHPYRFRDGPKVNMWLYVKPSDTVGHLKNLVKEKTAVPQRMQGFEYDGQSLDSDYKRLSDYDVRKRGEIWFNYGRSSSVSRRLYVKSDRPGRDTVTFKPEDSVSILEGTVAKKLGIQADQLQLVCNREVLRDRRGTLREQGVDDEGTIEIDLRKGKNGKFPVYAKYRGFKASDSQVNTYVSVDPRDTVAQLKRKIIAASPKLNLKGKKFELHNLEDETKTLAEYKVRVGDQIEVDF